MDPTQWKAMSDVHPLCSAALRGSVRRRPVHGLMMSSSCRPCQAQQWPLSADKWYRFPVSAAWCMDHINTAAEFTLFLAGYWHNHSAPGEPWGCGWGEWWSRLVWVKRNGEKLKAQSLATPPTIHQWESARWHFYCVVILTHGRFSGVERNGWHSSNQER